MNAARRVSYAFLCIVPFLSFVLAAVRPLRVAGIYQTVGAAYFAAIVIAAWILSAGAIRANVQDRRMLGLAGALLLAPFALMALLWVGIGGPWQATVEENEMRYVVLLAMSSAIVGGFSVLREAVDQAGERSYASLGWAAIVMGGTLYLVYNIFAFGTYFGREHAGAVPAAIVSLSDTLALLISVAGILAYLATLAFAASMGRVQWLGRWPTRVFMIVSGVASLLLALTGVHFPDPKALSTPWYTTPGFVVGIPAVPFFMPALLGVVLLRRAGNV